LSPTVLALIATAAVMHAAWNVLLKVSGDPLLTSGRAMLAGTIAAAPFAVIAWFATGQPAIPADGFALGVLSGVLEVVYFVLLAGAYRRGELSVVYPVARGTAPLLAVAAGVVLLGERLGFVGWLGVGALLAGILAVQRPWRILRGGGAMEAAVPWALATGVAIASYSTVDRVGAQTMPAWLYAAILFPVTAVGLAIFIRARGDRGVVGTAPSWTRATGAGLLAVGAYVLILAAYALAPLSIVSPLRESAIVLVSGWGALRLREAQGTRDAATRIGAAGLVVLGAVLLALGT
jgi:drug/metabolite transporter (DMT)-like permease